MVRINSFVLAGLAAVGASARPAFERSIDTSVNVGQQQCMTADEAQFVATNYGTLIATYSDALANQVLAENFTDYAEGVNTLINTCPQGAAAISLPLLAPTFTSRQMFETGQGQQPQINFQQLNIWNACNAVIIRWMTNNTAPIANPKPVVGLISMEVVRNPNATAAADYPWLIDYVYSEFDSGAWLQNLQEAGICGTPPANSSAIPDPTVSSSAGASAATCSCPVGTASLPSATSPATASSYPSAPAAIASPSAASSPATPTESSSSKSESSESSSAAAPSSTTAQTVQVGSDGHVTEEPCA